MATRFAVANGNWNTGATWDNGSVPVAGDTVYPNGFTVTIDTDINVDGLNNNIPPVYLPAMPIPLMTGNTQPSGVAFAGQNSSTAYQAFDYNSSTAWASTNLTNCTVGYQFTSGKIIKRYYLARIGENQRPTSWTFEGSNDGITWSAPLDTVTANTGSTFYLSGILANTTSYTYYRINITAVSSGTVANVRTLEMTESVGTVYGTTTGGSFTVPASLSGTRNIVQSGDGIKTNNSTILTIAATSGATVNFNIASGGFIFNQTAQRTATSTTPLINITGNCSVNFNANLWGNQSAYTSTYVTNGNINIGAAATVTVNGNLYGARSGFDNTNPDCIIATTAAGSTLNIIGDVYGGTVTNFAQTIYAKAITTINITGNIYGDLSAALFTTTTPTINIIGTVNLMNNNSVSAIQVSGYLILAQITINGYLVNKNNTMAIFANKIRFTANTNPYWVFQNSAAADITLAYGNPVTGPYPAEADVRYNTAYGASPTRYGTLRVPLPQYVSQGVLTDNTTGTAYLSATDVWNVLTSNITTPGSVGKLVSDNLNATVSSRASQTSVDTANTNINNLPANTTTEVWNKATSGLTTAGSIGERLKNASTVQTNGDQLAAYIV